jgi:hypothetical protein
MTKKNVSNSASITLRDLREGVQNTAGGDIGPGGMKIVSEAFDNLTGEIYAGLNIVKLEPGEAAGPFRLLRIDRDVEIARPGKKKNGTPGKVDKYVGEHLAFKGREAQMPIAASFLGKCDDSKLAVGDIFAFRRGENYTDKTYGQKNCQSFELKVLARAGAQADKFASDYSKQ